MPTPNRESLETTVRREAEALFAAGATVQEVTSRVFGPKGLLSTLAADRKEREAFVATPVAAWLRERLAEQRGREASRAHLHRWIGLWGVYLFVALLLALGRVLSPDFLSADSLLQVVRDVSILGIVAVGVSFVTVSGHFVYLSSPATNGMSSETLLFDITYRDANGAPVDERCVARLPPDDDATPVFPRYDMEMQFEAMRLVGARTSAPVPACLWLETDRAHLGTPFFVMRRVDGTVPPDLMPYTFGGNWLFDASPAEQRRVQDASVVALAEVGDDPAEQLNALIEADFNPAICTPSRLAAWCSFWGEAQSRPFYQEACGEKDDAYNLQLENICQRPSDAGGYNRNARHIARVIRVTIEGTWLDLMTMVAPYTRDEALTTVRPCLAPCFPDPFPPHRLIPPTPGCLRGFVPRNECLEHTFRVLCCPGSASESVNAQG